MDEESEKQGPSVGKLSKTPSWVMLGFIIGVLFVLALPRRPVPEQRPIVVAAQPEKPAQREAPLLTTVEALFAEWSTYAVWDGDVTQIAMWDAAVGSFNDTFEVRRIDGALYFRSIPSLTNRILRHGKLPPPECPLRFTETEEQYREWREHDRYERPPEDLRPTLKVPPAAPVTPVPSMSVTPVAPPQPTIEKESIVAPKK